MTADLPKNHSYTTYTVQAGDSLWSITWKYKVSIFELEKVDEKTIFDVIYEGNKLKVPQN